MAFPDLQVQLNSALKVPYVEYVSKTQSPADASFAAEGGGVNLGLSILVAWSDLETAIQQILGYSYRQTDKLGANPVLRRNLPMQHPQFAQLWCRGISSCRGLKSTGKVITNLGWATANFTLALLTLRFTRPRFRVLADNDGLLYKNDIPDQDPANIQEWVRYTDRHWKVDVQYLQVPQSTAWVYDEGAANGEEFTGSMGQKLPRGTLTRTWYELPQRALFTAEPDGFPTNLFLTVGGGGDSAIATLNTAAFFGCTAQTLQYLGAEIVDVPLQLPPLLMNLGFGETYPLQYNVNFHFSYWNPPLGNGATTRGHNLFPRARDNKWYHAKAKDGASTLFDLSDFGQLWTII